MPIELQWTRPAERDLVEIEEHIGQDRGPDVALDIVLRIIDAVEMILVIQPAAGRPGRVQDTRELVIKGLPYTVVYRVQERASREVQVLRVLHDAQRWPA